MPYVMAIMDDVITGIMACPVVGEPSDEPTEN